MVGRCVGCSLRAQPVDRSTHGTFWILGLAALLACLLACLLARRLPVEGGGHACVRRGRSCTFPARKPPPCLASRLISLGRKLVVRCFGVIIRRGRPHPTRTPYTAHPSRLARERQQDRKWIDRIDGLTDTPVSTRTHNTGVDPPSSPIRSLDRDHPRPARAHHQKSDVGPSRRRRSRNNSTIVRGRRYAGVLVLVRQRRHEHHP